MRSSCWAVVVAALMMDIPFTANAGEAPKLDLCDVTWLWPAPQKEDDLDQIFSIASLKTADGKPVWSDDQFEDLLRTADGDAAKVGNNRISLPNAVRSKPVWRIAAFRVDPTAPGGHELIRQNFGEKPQLRLILQPVTVKDGQVTVHDVAVHLVYTFVQKVEGQGEQPDRERFRQIIRDLDALKVLSEEVGASTSGKPLGIHPGLQKGIPLLTNRVRQFLSTHLHPDHLTAMAIMGLDGPEPWTFVALARPLGKERFGPVSFLPAQMLSFRTGRDGAVVPSPKVNNRNPMPSKLTMPADAKDRRGVATAALFGNPRVDADAFAVIGKDAMGENVVDAELRNRDIPDIIADPVRSHFFNTDCVSCHTETRRRLRMSLSPGKFAFREDGEIPAIEPSVLPKDDWNVRNLGWFPPHPFIGGGPTLGTVTQRTANETAEVVRFIERHYRSEEPNDAPAEDVGYLNQGWSDDERQDFYYVGQGSQLLPYQWFLALERANDLELVRSDRNLRSLGFIAQRPSARRNPDGLPIGFVKDLNPSTLEMKRGLLGKGFNMKHYPPTDDWLGLTCAACHTSETTFSGKRLRIDGGAAMADVESFLAQLAKAMRATVANDEKFERFKARIRENAGGDIDMAGLRDRLQEYTQGIERLVERNKSDVPYGLGRLDAFGAILNQICAASLGVEENRRPSSAPVSYPSLWNAPHMDWVQWNSSADIPISRNVGEVLGVFAHAQLTGTPATGQFHSSARLDYLHRLEMNLQKLQPPMWPEDVFGKIDRVKAEAGKLLYKVHCAKCHNERDEHGQYRMTDPNEFGKSFIKTTSIPFDKIGTDPQMAINFITRLAKPGVLQDIVQKDLDDPTVALRLERLKAMFQKLGLPEPNFDEQVPASLLLAAAVRGVIMRDLEKQLANRTPEERAAIVSELRGYRMPNTPPHGAAGYKANPLAGIWATAPYGHAGSVPNLFQWLSPVEKRDTSFFIGNHEFDPKYVGYSTERVEGAFEFRVKDDNRIIPGNSNAGHTGDGFTNFTNDERWQLIEYIKTLK